MQLPSHSNFVSITEYLRHENSATGKHEYRNGKVIAMAGGSAEHSLISFNLVREIGNALIGKKYSGFDSNLRVAVPGSARFYYPDLGVICGPPSFDPNDKSRQSINNPSVLVEVLSPGTEAFDRGEKFDDYRKLDSLIDYILVSQAMARVELFHRQPDGTWNFSTFAGLEGKLRIPAIDAEIPLSGIYLQVDFPPTEL